MPFVIKDSDAMSFFHNLRLSLAAHIQAAFSWLQTLLGAPSFATIPLVWTTWTEDDRECGLVWVLGTRAWTCGTFELYLLMIRIYFCRLRPWSQHRLVLHLATVVHVEEWRRRVSLIPSESIIDDYSIVWLHHPRWRQLLHCKSKTRMRCSILTTTRGAGECSVPYICIGVAVNCLL